MPCHHVRYRALIALPEKGPSCVYLELYQTHLRCSLLHQLYRTPIQMCRLPQNPHSHVAHLYPAVCHSDLVLAHELLDTCLRALSLKQSPLPEEMFHKVT